MGTGVEFMREHVPSNTRIHYIVSNGGAAPNIVPDTAELFLYARSQSLNTLDGIWGRIVKIGQGAAMMTETTLDVKIIGSDTNIVANDALAKVAQKNLEEVGGFGYTAEDEHFAENCRRACRRAAPAMWPQPPPSSRCARSIRTSPPLPRTWATSVGMSRPSASLRQHLCLEWWHTPGKPPRAPA